VTRGQLPQRAGLPVLNGGGAAAAVPPIITIAENVIKDTEYGFFGESGRHLLLTFLHCIVIWNTEIF